MSNDLVNDGHINKALKGAGGLAGGITLWVLNGLSFPAALIAGGVLFGAGFLMNQSARKNDKPQLASWVTMGAGALTLVSAIPLLGWMAGSLLFTGGLALVVGGALSLWQLIRGKGKS